MKKFEFNADQSSLAFSLGIPEERSTEILTKMYATVNDTLNIRADELVLENKQHWIEQAEKSLAGNTFRLDLKTISKIEPRVMAACIELANSLDLNDQETLYFFFVVGNETPNIRQGFDEILTTKAQRIFMQAFNEGKPDNEKMEVLMINANDPKAAAIVEAHAKAVQAMADEEAGLAGEIPDYPFPYTGPIAHA